MSASAAVPINTNQTDNADAAQHTITTTQAIVATQAAPPILAVRSSGVIPSPRARRRAARTRLRQAVHRERGQERRGDVLAIIRDRTIAEPVEPRAAVLRARYFDLDVVIIVSANQRFDDGGVVVLRDVKTASEICRVQFATQIVFRERVPWWMTMVWVRHWLVRCVGHKRRPFSERRVMFVHAGAVVGSPATTLR